MLLTWDILVSNKYSGGLRTSILLSAALRYVTFDFIKC